MICMKPQCCVNCNIKDECPCNCGYHNVEFQREAGINSLREFEEIFCLKCSFKNYKNLEE